MTDYIPDPYSAALDAIRTPAQRAYIEARDQLIEARAAAQPHRQQNDNDDSPCPYCAPVAALRAATQAPKTQFEERWRNMRRRELNSNNRSATPMPPTRSAPSRRTGARLRKS